MGNRLRKLKKRVKGLGGKIKKTKFVVGRVIKAKVLKCRLTDSVIDTFQNYLGIALRSGHKSVDDLRHALLASFIHVVSSKERNFRSAYCPKSSDSWCQYQRDVCNKSNLHKHGPGKTDFS